MTACFERGRVWEEEGPAASDSDAEGAADWDEGLGLLAERSGEVLRMSCVRDDARKDGVRTLLLRRDYSGRLRTHERSSEEQSVHIVLDKASCQVVPLHSPAHPKHD